MFNNLDDFIRTTQHKQLCAFYRIPLTGDTETSHNHDDINPLAWVYQWAVCLDAAHEIALTGRTIKELLTTLQNIDTELTQISKILGRCSKVVIYFHNLPYDYTYIRQILATGFDIKNEFYIDKRHILKVDIGEHIILKDSFKYFNMSLEKVCETYDTPHKKLVGTVDYNAIHYSDDVLTGTDWNYQLNDVYGLQEALISDFELNNYNVITAPLTSTGKVRRICHNASDNDNNARNIFLRSYPTPFEYKVMRNTFTGAFTHGNRFYRGVTIDDKYFGKDVKIVHRDFRSDYPSCMRKYKFPVGKFWKIKKPTIKDFFRKDYNTWGLIGADSVELKDKECPFPFLSASKTDSRYNTEICDNGRVLEINEKFTTYVTEYDLRILLEQYTFTNLKVLLAYQCKSEFLPSWFTDTIDLYYKKKTDLKEHVKYLEKTGASRDAIYTANMELLFVKQFLNGLYGMTAQDVCKPPITRDEHGALYVGNIDYKKCLNKHYGKYGRFTSPTSNGFLPYYWSIYTTSTSRYELYNCCKICGDNFLYADTDSIFYISSNRIEKKFEKLNNHKRRHAIKKGLYIKSNSGKLVTYDSFDIEDTGSAFRFLHAKCYAYETSGQLKVTVSGVANRRLIDVKDGKPVYFYSSDELGDINNLQDNFTFKKCGSTKVKYVELPLQDVTINGHLETVGDGAIISENKKQITIGTDDFITFYADEIRKGIYHNG